MRRSKGPIVAVVLVGLGAAGMLHAAPHRPASGDEVLQRLPAATQMRALAGLRAAAVASPGDPRAAMELARRYLELGRRTDDPRAVAYALTALAPWVRRKDASADALTMAATAAQYLHQFDEALGLLDRALLVEPRNPQALLVRANLLEVRGDLAAARPACARLGTVTAQLVAIACLSSVASRDGQLQSSFDNLATVQATSPRLPDDVQVWLLTILADMADRLGETQRQSGYLAAALAIAPQDLKVKAALADALLARGRYTEVLELLRDDEQHDGLLLRLAIAARAAPAGHGKEAARYAALFRERQALSGGEGRHRREQARFLLEVDANVVAAARLARENWAVQREPEDLRLLQHAARRSGDRQLLALGEAWIAEHHYEDRRLQ